MKIAPFMKVMILLFIPATSFAQGAVGERSCATINLSVENGKLDRETGLSGPEKSSLKQNLVNIKVMQITECLARRNVPHLTQDQAEFYETEQRSFEKGAISEIEADIANTQILLADPHYSSERSQFSGDLAKEKQSIQTENEITDSLISLANGAAR